MLRLCDNCSYPVGPHVAAATRPCTDLFMMKQGTETYRLGPAGRYTHSTKTCSLLMSALQQIYLRLCSDQSIYITRSDCSLLLRSSSLLILYQAHSISIIVDGTIPLCRRNGRSMMWESVILSGTGQQKTGRLLRCSAAATHVSCMMYTNYLGKYIRNAQYRYAIRLPCIKTSSIRANVRKYVCKKPKKRLKSQVLDFEHVKTYKKRKNNNEYNFRYHSVCFVL